MRLQRAATTAGVESRRRGCVATAVVEALCNEQWTAERPSASNSEGSDAEGPRASDGDHDADEWDGDDAHEGDGDVCYAGGSPGGALSSTAVERSGRTPGPIACNSEGSDAEGSRASGCDQDGDEWDGDDAHEGDGDVCYAGGVQVAR